MVKASMLQFIHMLFTVVDRKKGEW